MKHVFLALMLCVYAGGAGRAADKVALPMAPVPPFVVAEANNGNFIITMRRDKVVMEEHSYFEQKGDVLAAKKKLVPVIMQVTEQFALKGSDVRVYEQDGSLVAPADAAVRLKDATLVVLSADDKMIDPAYRAMLNRKVLILVNSQAKAAAPPLPRETTPPLPPGKP